MCAQTKLFFYVQKVAAIDCNFTFVESETTGLMNKAAKAQVMYITDTPSLRKFDCNQNLDEEFEFTFVNESAKPNGLGNRFNSQESFELQETTCISSKRFITPRALNNIYNQLIILNSATYVQRIEITECR